MKSRRIVKWTLNVFAAAFLLFCAAAAQASSIGFHFSVNTSGLISNLSSPFALDFQLNGGNALGNTATISNFTFDGGSANSSPVATPLGLASGSLFSSVQLSDNAANAFNEFYQGFTPGAFLTFDVLLTTNINSPTPDAFSFAILDKNLANIPAAGIGDSLILVNLDSSQPRAQTYSGTGAFSNVNAWVPESSSLLLVTFAIAGMGIIGYRRTPRS